MTVGIYWSAFLFLVPISVFLANRGAAFRRPRPADDPDAESPQCVKDEEAYHFRWMFLSVYLLVMGSEWLQVRRNSPCHCSSHIR